MIKNIVFDMGWVLVEYKPMDYIHEFISDEKDATLIEQEMFKAPEWDLNDRGTIEPDVFIRTVCSRLPERLHSAARQIWEHWHEYIKPIPETSVLAEELKKNGYHIYVLSNVSTRYCVIRNVIPAISSFDGEFASADVHYNKPEKEIYELFFDRFHLNPEECFFIDDNAANIAAAGELGMRGFCFTQDLEALKSALKIAGVKV